MATLFSSQSLIFHCLVTQTLNPTKPFALRRFSRHNCGERHLYSSESPKLSPLKTRNQRALSFTTVCSAADEPSSSEISSTARIRSEVLSPFRSVRMFFYLAFIASGSLGGLIAASQLIGALANPARSAQVPETLKGLGIDIGAVSLFAFLYLRESKAKNAQVARLSREESLSKLKLRVVVDAAAVSERIISVGDLRGVARLVICAAPAEFVEEAFKRSKEFTEGLLERGVLVVPYATDGNSLDLDFKGSDIEDDDDEGRKQRRMRLWRLAPVYITEWAKWIEEQKKLAGVSSDSPVYLSLRLDGRVRGGGVGYPPWQALVAQLPPVKGMWTGLLDGFDGRV